MSSKKHTLHDHKLMNNPWAKVLEYTYMQTQQINKCPFFSVLHFKDNLVKSKKAMQWKGYTMYSMNKNTRRQTPRVSAYLHAIGLLKGGMRTASVARANWPISCNVRNVKNLRLCSADGPYIRYWLLLLTTASLMRLCSGC